MIETALEGVESLRFACSWILVIGGIAALVVGPRRVPVAALITVATAVVVAWLRFGGYWFSGDSTSTQILMGLAIAALTWFAHTQRANQRFGEQVQSASQAVLAATVTAAATTLWVPCVGSSLGDILNAARTEPFAQLPATIVFMVAIMLPVAAIGALFALLDDPDGQPRTSVPTVLKIVVALAVAAALLSGTIDEFASLLARRAN